jgi:hypothetical protein
MTLHRDLLQELEKNLIILEELGNLSQLPNLLAAPGYVPRLAFSICSRPVETGISAAHLSGRVGGLNFPLHSGVEVL